jgi:hypothetical protein
MEDLTGKRFGRWTVKEFVGRTKQSHDLWKVRCDCGTEKVTGGRYLRGGSSHSCGCLAAILSGSRITGNSYRRKDLTGRRFGRYVVLEFAGKSGNHALFKCLCTCGTTKIVQGTSLLSGDTKSCGCLADDNRLKHGHAKTGKVMAEYRAWASMNQRCHNRTCKAWPWYGKRGTSVDLQWRSEGYGGDGQGYERFLAYLLATIGMRPGPEFSIDRWPNECGNYEPGNIRWATKSQQTENQRPRRRQINRAAQERAKLWGWIS